MVEDGDRVGFVERGDAEAGGTRVLVWCWLERQRGVGLCRVQRRRTGAGVAGEGFGVEHGARGVDGAEPGTPVLAREAGRVGYKGLHVGPFSVVQWKPISHCQMTL